MEWIEKSTMHTMVDYMRAGLNISSIMCIDFTGSNGPMDDPDSLHYIDPEGIKMNPYQSVIEKVGAIIESYDND